jgi:hypothetical protein
LEPSELRKGKFFELLWDTIGTQELSLIYHTLHSQIHANDLQPKLQHHSSTQHLEAEREQNSISGWIHIFNIKGAARCI